MTGEKSATDESLADKAPMDNVAAYVAGYGVRSRPLREILSLLTRGSQPIEVLIAHTATPRRAVEELLRSLGTDLAENRHGYRLRPEVIAEYRARFALDRLEPAGAASEARDDDLGALDLLIKNAPAPRRDLDHVAATAGTLARRATWLDTTYDLAGRRVLLVGDHDLTSVALARRQPGVEITVVDLDERTLAYIDATARSEGLSIRTLFGDLRFTLPPAAREWADLVLTDPPYTPEGVGLFLGRALAGLGDRKNGVVVVAYGHSRLHPMLGFQVQQSMQQFGVVFEAILPAFNRYDGAQAVGSASDLYVCAPTSRTWKVLERAVESFGTRIYTHGTQSVESTAAVELGPAATVIGDATAAGSPGARRLGLRSLFTGSDYLRDLGDNADVAVDLTADPGPLLLRALLAVTARKVRFVVPVDHPDVSTPGARAALASLVAPKYRLTFPPPATAGRPRGAAGNESGGYEVVHADLVDAGAGESEVGVGVADTRGGADGPIRPPASDVAARWLLERAHGRIGNVLREGVIRAAARDGRTLSKNDARTLVRAQVGTADLDTLDLAAIETPRARLERVLQAVRAPRAAPAPAPQNPNHGQD
ncbi:bis-aminopropyl spermidine synthase family protein [Frankia sp. Mgl5]|uniref:bis-aminopropyl spermidine synthase family protein n=1 Tax=Frankia sp. Mgl5 TaxID=2933793 RepID=UPI00200D9323|nr:bis-aminopropyl spermidine synthase family protein [Frankia sp. Mgl5]MCK9926789.1 bis-aminopropyl spermidine synthase family protein [Frankia sp. Mgl5]